ncbi:hypothetical protein Tco_0157173 [Tanacetum coccineum]
MIKDKQSYLIKTWIKVAKLKVLDAIPDIMNKSATSLDRFADAISSPLLALKISKSNKNVGHLRAKSDFDDEPHPSRPMVKYSKTKAVTKFSFITKFKEKYQLSEKEIKNQKLLKNKLKQMGFVLKDSEAKSCSSKLLVKKQLKNCLEGKLSMKMYKNDDTVKSSITSKEKIDDFNKMSKYLELDHYLPLSEQDLISIQFNDHPIGIVLNEPTLGMILFIDPDKQDFIIINDFDDWKDETQYKSKCADDGY